jgi:predicted nucleotidyltransferase
VAAEAANLLYFGDQREYKQAKEQAAETLGTSFLPSNREVALELDRIAQEQEGTQRKERLIQMRQEALAVMRVLEAFCPVLVGSVWRGTIKRGSDIDITAYADDPQKVVEALKASDIKIAKAEWTRVNKQGKTLTSYHIYTQTQHGLEIVVRGRGEIGEKRKCEIFGDEMKGLGISELQRVLEANPTRRFIPE